jgi:hypothetical protein
MNIAHNSILPDDDMLSTLIAGYRDHVTHGMFRLRCNNAKKRGKMQPLKNVTCEGTLYSSGHTNLDTQELPVYDFLSFGQMEDYLSQWGNYTVEWLGRV